MKKVQGLSTSSTNPEGNEVEESFFTYDEEEQQQNEVNAANAKLIFTPEFIPYYPALRKLDLTTYQILIYGFIKFYITNGTGRFYFTNNQIAEIFNCGERTVTEALTRLAEKRLLIIKRKIRAGGGQIRFIQISDSQKSTSLASRKVPTNKNKIKENYITNVIGGVPPEESEVDPQTYGNEIMTAFEESVRKANGGILPTSKSERIRRRGYWNMLQMLGIKAGMKKKVDIPPGLAGGINDFVVWLRGEYANKGYVLQTTDKLKEKVHYYRQNVINQP